MAIVPYKKQVPAEKIMQSLILGGRDGDALHSYWRSKHCGNHGFTSLLYIKDIAMGEGYYCAKITASREGYPYFSLIQLSAKEIIDHYELIVPAQFQEAIIGMLNNVFDFLF